MAGTLAAHFSSENFSAIGGEIRPSRRPVGAPYPHTLYLKAQRNEFAGGGRLTAGPPARDMNDCKRVGEAPAVAMARQAATQGTSNTQQADGGTDEESHQPQQLPKVGYTLGRGQQEGGRGKQAPAFSAEIRPGCSELPVPVLFSETALPDAAAPPVGGRSGPRRPPLGAPGMGSLQGPN